MRFQQLTLSLMYLRSLFTSLDVQYELCESTFESKKHICTVSLSYGKDRQAWNINPLKCAQG